MSELWIEIKQDSEAFGVYGDVCIVIARGLK